MQINLRCGYSMQSETTMKFTALTYKDNIDTRVNNVFKLKPLGD